MAQITSRKELEDWLKEKPADWAQVVAARAALRVLPYAFTEHASDAWVTTHGLALIRALLISWAARNFPSHDMTSAANAVANSASDAITEAATNADVSAAATYAIYSAARAADATMYNGLLVVNAAADAVFGAVDSSAYLDAVTAIWASLIDDCERLEGYYPPNAARVLTRKKLWPAGEPDGWFKAWHFAADRLRRIDESYGVWMGWYARRISGERASFGILGDKRRKEDKVVLRKLADATNEDFWEKGAIYVNTTLQSWIDEAWERTADETSEEPTPPTSDTIRAVAAEIASPTVTLTNNKLDVTANTAFDGQTDAANLDEAIAVLRAVVAALLGGLPGNAPRSFAANLTIYDSELAKRDAKPFLGVLVRMGKSVNAGFHAEPELFDAGVTTNFESYFDAHLAFMTHYRRNEEREAKIAQFTIDDAAASGVALTGPVDDVVKEVDALAEQGLVTDGFVQAIKEQQAINDEVALYTSTAPAISGEPTVKARHILQTVGFYERALAVASNAITVAKPLVAFIKILKEAIEALLKFFV